MPNKTINDLSYRNTPSLLDNLLISDFSQIGSLLRISVTDFFGMIKNSLNLWSKPQIVTPVQLTSNIIDCNLSNIFVCTLIGNTIWSASNITNGQTVIIRVNTMNFTLTTNNTIKIKNLSGIVPNTTTFITLIGFDGVLYGSLISGFL